MTLPILMPLPPGRGRPAALHRDRDDAAAAARRSAGLAGRKMDRLPGDAGRHRDLDAQRRHLGGARDRGRPPRRITDDPKSDSAAALEPRRAPARLRLDARRRRRRSGWSSGGRRHAAEGDVAAHGSGRRALGRRADAARHLRRLPRLRSRVAGGAYDAACNRKHLEEATRPVVRRACTTASSIRHWNALGGPAALPPARGRRGQRRRARPHPGRRPTSRRSPSAAPTTTTSSPDGKEVALRAQGRRPTDAISTERRALRRARRRRRGHEGLGQPRLRRRAALQPGRDA